MKCLFLPTEDSSGDLMMYGKSFVCFLFPSKDKKRARAVLPIIAGIEGVM